jgi:hypothetical protein
LLKPFPLILFLFSLIYINHVYAQVDSSAQVKSNKDTSIKKNSPGFWQDTTQIDLVDVWHLLSKHKGDTANLGAQKPVKYHVAVVPAIGYTYSTGWAAIVAANIGFYTADPLTTNISSITPSVVYSQYNQLTISFLTNLWSKNNNYNYVTDWRFYKYPQYTYGLGGYSSLKDSDLIDYSQFRIHQSVLKKITPDFYAGLGYFLDYHWNIKEAGQENGQESDAEKYGLTPTSSSSGAVVNVLFDNRKSSINPQGGIYANAVYRDNLVFLGSNTNWQSLTLDVRDYFRFPKHSRNILAFWSYDWLTLSGKPPYLDLPSTGWDAYNNTGRGYIQGRFRSPNMIYLETEYRFAITRNGLFGGVVFANAETFSEYPSNSFEVIWPAAGFGLRLKVNKHSNANLALDYGWGADGSHGLYVNIGEVF